MGGIQYIIAASVCLSFFYGAYRLIFRYSTNFRQARIYLMFSVILSVLIPLSGYRIQTGLSWPGKAGREITVTVINAAQGAEKVIPVKAGLWSKLAVMDLPRFALYLYFVITVLLLVRILIMLTMLYVEYRKSLKVHLDDCTLLYSHRFSHTFSFFRWIFVHSDDTGSEINQIITHEKVHVNQYHSLDILIIELLSAVMWFNPFVWIMKGSLQLVHEYLADKGALDTGIDKSEYQALLINQVAEERIVRLSSSFNQSLIKKRIIMMTKTKIQNKSVKRLLTLLPVTLMLFVLMAVFNGMSIQKVTASPAGMFITSNMGSLASMPVVPPDTIIKKTVIKKISKDNPGDTIVEVREEIITGDEAARERETIRHMDRHEGRGGVREHAREREDVVIIDSMRHTGGEARMEKHVTIRHTGDEKPSDVLYLLDGEPFYRPIESLDPKTIESIDVIKGKDVSKYTKEDFDAVIVIKTVNGK